MKEYTLVLTGPEVILIGQALEEQPYKTVTLLMHKIQLQINVQNDAANGDAKPN